MVELYVGYLGEAYVTTTLDNRVKSMWSRRYTISNDNYDNTIYIIINTTSIKIEKDKEDYEKLKKCN